MRNPLAGRLARVRAPSTKLSRTPPPSSQTTQNLAINWQSFSIGRSEAVRFIQPNSSSIALNRVLGQNPTSILGSLSANGQVFVLNPNGVLFGARLAGECRWVGCLHTEPERYSISWQAITASVMVVRRACRQSGHPHCSTRRLHCPARARSSQRRHHYRHAGHGPARRRRQSHPQSQQWFAAFLHNRSGLAQRAGREQTADSSRRRTGVHVGQGG